MELPSLKNRKLTASEVANCYQYQASKISKVYNKVKMFFIILYTYIKVYSNIYMYIKNDGYFIIIF